MLENIVKKTKVGLTAVALGVGLYGCATPKVRYPLAERIIQQRQLYHCGGDNNPNLYCDETYVYPVVVMEFK